jgi:hypothetical protein
MAYEQRDNSGSLFKNDRKESDKHPDYTGQIMVGGVLYWLSAWIKTGRNGGKFMSLAIKPKDERRADPTPRAEIQDDMNDEIPF